MHSIQAYMPSKHIVYRHRLSHHHSLTATEPPHQTSCSAVSGEASTGSHQVNFDQLGSLFVGRDGGDAEVSVFDAVAVAL
jgi:hypothetical protein